MNQMTLPPPAPPAQPKKSHKLLLGAILGITGAVAVGVGGIAVTQDGSSDAATPPSTTHAPTTTAAADTVTVAYSLSVMGEWCEDVENVWDEMWGFDDIPGMEFQIRNEQDEVIGHGSLELTGTDTDSSCDFYAANIEVEKSDVYQVGNNDRGWVTWDSTDVSNGFLIATATL